jgi:YgiT-type zinc finger domain-containing protein
MNCYHCRSGLNRGTADYTESRGGYLIVLRDVPAWTCPQCGEALFEESVVERIQEVLAHIDEQAGRLRDVA